jgi:hypothetical protein
MKLGSCNDAPTRLMKRSSADAARAPRRPVRRRLRLQHPPPQPSRCSAEWKVFDLCSGLIRAEGVHLCLRLIGSAHVVLTGLRGRAGPQGSARARFTLESITLGVYMAAVGYFLWWTLRLAGSYGLFHSSSYGGVRRPTTAALVRPRGAKAVPITAGKQPGTASIAAKYSGRNRGFLRSRSIYPLLFLLQITARTAKFGQENGRAYSSRYLIEQP